MAEPRLRGGALHGLVHRARQAGVVRPPPPPDAPPTRWARGHHLPARRPPSCTDAFVLSGRPGRRLLRLACARACVRARACVCMLSYCLYTFSTALRFLVWAAGDGARLEDTSLAFVGSRICLVGIALFCEWSSVHKPFRLKSMVHVLTLMTHVQTPISP